MSSRMPCPKCGSGGTNLIDRSTAWNPTPNGVEYSCHMCGFRLYGQKAMDKVTEYRAMQANREALLKSMQEQEAKRLAEARSREAQLRKGISSIRKEEAVKLSPPDIQAEKVTRQAEELRAKKEQEERLAAEELRRKGEEEEARIAREVAEEARKVRAEQARLAWEQEEARSAARREQASQKAARWAEIEVMREREAIRIAQTRVLQDRERGARYRAKKRAERLAAKATEASVVEVKTPEVEVPETLEAPAPEWRIVESSYTEIIAEITPAYPVTHLNLDLNIGDLSPVLEIHVSEPEQEAPQSSKCAWHECDKPHTEISKYCSRNCSVKNSRARDRERARARKMGTLDVASSAK